ncbi:MAG: hypothetical protein K9N07_07670 [Candidatus Cloacimonetes bacterium]|nr:hypothetical protein [Candidatus Cloacimonadota bacterium]MCF8012794.1 hypothetical protein [Candidatus Woesearchaeota archaeon]
MVTVQEKIDEIENGLNYVTNSLILKSHDDRGLVIKWLEQDLGVAERKEIFIELNEDESHMAVEKRTSINSIEVEPAGG